MVELATRSLETTADGLSVNYIPRALLALAELGYPDHYQRVRICFWLISSSQESHCTCPVDDSERTVALVPKMWSVGRTSCGLKTWGPVAPDCCLDPRKGGRARALTSTAAWLPRAGL